MSPLSSSPPPEDDYYSVVNQSRRFEEEYRRRKEARRQAKAQRLERAKLEAELEAARAQLKRLEEEQQGPDYPVYFYGMPPSHPPVRPGYRPPDLAIGSHPQVVDGARRGMHLNRAATIRGGWTDLTMLEEPTTHGISQVSCLAVRRCIRISVSTLSPGDPDTRETPINSVVGHERA
jgi:hypothetical protein